MKRVIIILTAIWFTLNLQAQTNPKIAGLVDYACSVEGSHVKYFCGYNGTYYESVYLFLEPRFDKFVPNFANDSITHLTDSLKQLELKAGRPIYNAIRRTCQSLSRDAEESYMWESHLNGKDSIKYTILLKKGDIISPNSISNTTHRELYDSNLRNFHTLVGKESLKFEFGSYYRYKEPTFPEGERPLDGWGQLDYRYAVDTVRGEIEHFDKKGYRIRIEKLLSNTNHLTSRPIYLSHDSTYLSVGDMVYFVNSPHGVGKYNEQKKDWDVKYLRPQSETEGIIYTTHSKEVADSMLHLIVSSTKAYLKEHPHIRYKFYPKARYEETLSPVFTGENGTGAVEDYRIFVHRDQNNEYHILAFDTKGELWIPLEWPELKSWKNGQASYYSRKMSKLDLTVYTRSRDMEERGWDSSR